MLRPSISKLYARALFDFIPDKKSAIVCLQELNDQFLMTYDFWNNPLIESEQYLDFFKVTGKALQLPKTWVSFGNLLLENKRIKLLPSILKEYIFLCGHHTPVTITTSTPFSPQGEKKLIQWIKHNFKENLGKNVTLALTVDESLLGGFKIESETFVYDASVKTHLKNLEKALL